MTLRGKHYRVRSHNGRLRKQPTLLVRHNFWTEMWVRTGKVVRHWRMAQVYL